VVIAPDEEGIAFGRYRLLRRLAVGGMAEVFLARKEGDPLGRAVAVKRILPEYAEHPEILRSLLNEARVVTQLNHPFVVSVHDVGEVDGMVYLAMEFVNGLSFNRVLKRWWKRRGGTDLPWPIACRIAATVCEALQYAHELKDTSGRPLGLIHRDVNPANIMLAFSGAVKLTDFGIALSSVKQDRTAPGIVKAKLEYSAPEQYRDRPLDARTDVYGLGLTLYHALTGKQPFKRKPPAAAIKAILEEPVPSLEKIRPDVPMALALLVARCVTKEPADRIQSAAEVRLFLEAVLAEGRRKVGLLEIARFMGELLVPQRAQPAEVAEAGVAHTLEMNMLAEAQVAATQIAATLELNQLRELPEAEPVPTEPHGVTVTRLIRGGKKGERD
jgi:serine/threonine-protein kinase